MINKNKTMPTQSSSLSKTNQSGFTLVELLVVVAIIVTLSVVAIVSLGGETNKARDARRLSDIANISSALQSYQIENGTYPTNLADMPRSLISNIPTDPGQEGHAYDYITNVAGNAFAIAATLEGNGDPAHYEAYVLTNSDDDLLDGPTYGVEWNDPTFDPCGAATYIVNEGSCLPYDPNNP